MGTHRSGTRSRSISKGPVIAASVLVLVLVGVFGWFQLSDRAASTDVAAAAECVEGPASLDITVDPAIAGPVLAAADRYNASKPRVRDHCAQVKVSARPSEALVAGLGAVDQWDPALGPKPGLWIADSSRSIDLVRVPGLIEGAPASIATSPIVLAVPDALRQALEQYQITWSDLPRLQQGSLDEVGLSGWGGLRMALPVGDATTAAAAAIGAEISGTEPLTEQAAGSGQVVAAISGLAAGAQTPADLMTATAAISDDPTADDIHAVAATEQQLGVGGLTAFRPAGTAPIADYPAAVISGPWVDTTQNLIASRFIDFLRAPESAGALAADGFGPAIGSAPANPSKEALQKVRATLANPVLGVNATVLLDVSSSMGTAEGSMTRLANAGAAIASTLQVMPPDFGLGLWTFGKNLDGTTPYQVQVETELLTDNQRTAVASAVTSTRASQLSADQAYPSLLAAYRAAITGYSPGRTNSILLITDGPDDDSTLSGTDLINQITAATKADTPVRIDVIVVGGEGSQTLQTVAEQTGGTYTRLSTSNDLGFGTAVVKALTTP
ncbi:substrate-binding domain-containing protein [Nocardia mangyaensis]|uniref:substrate-binding domain-containing protein n=1 Tax=Nocardia mangyaensis TaxID=2213200 RepID=UPI0026750641|nr:substrate-binding domain-containing protein [Nocardia mangyaensis]MDO3650896.1 substrate-binding domain-containing protein [Nocardia mangyaensis]